MLRAGPPAAGSCLRGSGRGLIGSGTRSRDRGNEPVLSWRWAHRLRHLRVLAANVGGHLSPVTVTMAAWCVRRSMSTIDFCFVMPG